MRRFFYILGALFLGILIIGGTSIGVAAYKGRALDAESKAFVDAEIPRIAQDWSEAELLHQATPELRNSTTPEQLDWLFNGFRQLGTLVAYKGSVGGSLISYRTGVGETVSASYIAKARFQNGAVTFRVALLKQNGRWLISGFHVQSDSIVPPALRSTGA
ncbi:MAG TPA: hypothetical protein VMF67_11305 [Rhizomicrobium sp.]|nr:hypothetical protein [Rhizomicrobium sp.]